MSIRARIWALVGCFALMALTVTGLGLMTIGDYNRMLSNYDLAYDNAWRGERLNHLISNVVMETRGLYMAKNGDDLKIYVRNLNMNLDEMDGFLHQWNEQMPESQRNRLATINHEASAFIELRRKVANLAVQGKLQAAEEMSTSNRTARIDFQTHVEALVTATRIDLATAKAVASSYSRHRSGDFLITALLGILIISLMSFWVVAHFITNPLKAIASAIISTSKGEFGLPMHEPEGHDEVSSVWRALAVLKERSLEAERLAAAKREAEHQEELKLREILLD